MQTHTMRLITCCSIFTKYICILHFQSVVLPAGHFGDRLVSERIQKEKLEL